MSIKKEENDPVATIEPQCPITTTTAIKFTGQKTSVNFNNFSIKINKFTDEGTNIRVNHNETTRAVYKQAFSCILRNFHELTELRKIKCKIKG